MKKIAVILCFFVVSADAAVPSSSCPDGYTAIDEPTVIIATTCPSGTMAVATVQSCLVATPGGDCMMYAPSGVSYTDDAGTYQFVGDVCPMTE